MHAVDLPLSNERRAIAASNDNVNSTDTLQQKTQQAFVTLSLITQACHGILNTVLVAPSPKPAWFDGLQSKLDTAKAHATQWIDNIAPGVTGGVPVQVINYGTTYSAFTAQIMSIVNAHPDAQGATNQYVVQVKQLVEALDQSVSNIITNAETTAQMLKEWGDLMQKSHDDLVTGAANIQSAETDLATDIQKMNNAISTLNEMIHKENIAIAASAGGIGLGLLLLIAGIALAPETGGASAYLVAGTGAALIIGGSVTWGVMQAKIDKQFKEIAADQKELDDDKRQLVALQGLASSSNQSIQYVTDSTNALSDFRTSWAVFQGELQGVKAKLDLAETSLSTIVQGAFTTAAANEWADATNFAESLANAPVKVVAKQLPMQSQAA
ncbi:alpha-pore-forming cytotoxin MakA [Massilia niastensis]|uniref:alpha-pore-forming cytotoxin MakA n=1 Tax=Massilia niastensis TaxID=544911 RepID=UPI0003819F80|nr:HBL/NHE enterotoxin family protein [Massilia niastensis]